MSQLKQVAVLVNASTPPAQLDAFQAACPHHCEVFAVSDAVALQQAVQKVYAQSVRVFHAVVNLCVDVPHVPGGVTAQLAAVFLEQGGLPYTGCRAATLNYPLDIVMMMLWYAEVPLPPFAIVDSNEAARQAAQHLTAPLRLRSACAILGQYEEDCVEQSEVEATLLRVFEQHGKLVTWQVNQSLHSAVRVLVAGGTVKGAAAVVPLDTSASTAHPPSWWADGEAAARHAANAVSRYVLYNCGVAALTLNTLEGESTKWCFEDIILNPPLADLLAAADAADTLVSGTVTLPQFVSSLLAEATTHHPEPTFAIQLHEDSRKGYHLCAARALQKGELVFGDETRSFAVVTRPHVERHWDNALKKTFTEYAWPLDSEGHLYAIWEENPLRWRPLNHSCDPNCVFAAPHSLNVIAARGIAAGEDLSMDYATFCDDTMKAFQCLCGAACCRGLIRPDAASLAKYGGNAWLRRVPPPVKPLLPR